ncbi:type VI secretion system membrane subunit TssM [Serratia sp. S1B]|nr:type VI secretion system membrane subunit TssM [Serratia sp. S1B]
MSYLSRFFSPRNLKLLMLLACAILISVAIWLLGPFSGFGSVHPLESKTARVLLIVATLFWIARWWWRIPFFIPLAFMVSVLVWVAGPWLMAGKHYPLADVSRRLIILFLIWLVVLIYAAWLVIQALLNNPTLLNRVKNFGRQSNMVVEQHDEIARRIRHAVALTNRVRTNWKRWWSTLLPGSLPDTVPWYVILGSESAGKTALVTASSQDFPLPEQLSRVARDNPPTAHCECWFGNDALFLDTAGKYVSDDEAALTEWQYLLSTLYKYRARDGINGTIVAVSAEDILHAGKEGSLTLATRIRARLNDIRQQLGVHFPVYVVITKLDQLSGFDSWFRSMPAEARQQVWGITFPWELKKSTSATELKEKISAEFTSLQERLVGSLHLRQQEEYALGDRKEMYTFPMDFQQLCVMVTDFLQQAFFSSRYDETQFCTSFRGVYFASSCQPATIRLHNHGTIVSRWRNYFTPPEKNAQFSSLPWAPAESTPVGMVWAKQYFLRQLFAEVIIKDAPLATHNLREEARFRLQRLFAHCAIALLAVVLIKGFIVSFGNNSTYLDAIIAKTQRLEAVANDIVHRIDDKKLATLLALSRQLPDFENLILSQPPLEYQYGLYTGTAVASHADGLYRYLLQYHLLPTLQNQATESLITALQAQDPDALYNALKIYLSLFAQDKNNSPWLIDAVTQQWERVNKLESFQDSTQFTEHLTALFALSNWHQFGLKVNDGLIAQARNQLAQRSLNVRLYQRVKTQLIAQMPGALTLDNITGNPDVQIFTLSDDELAHDGIPVLFTRVGYQELVKKKSLYFVTRLQHEDDWVMGAKEAGKVDPFNVYQGVMQLYLREYTRYWNHFLNNVQLIALDDIPMTDASPLDGDIYLLRILAATDSPLINLAREAVAQTTLVQKNNNITSQLDDTLLPGTNNRALTQVKKLNDVSDEMIKKLTRTEVDDQFKPLREFVSGQGSLNVDASPAALPGSQMNKLTSTLGELYTLFVMTNNSFRNGETPMMPDMEKKVSIQAQIWPEPFRNIIAPFLSNSSARVEAQTLVRNNNNIDSTIGETCRVMLENKYPFADGPQEVSLRDFERFFARDGVVDSWFKQNLADKVDTSQRQWRYRDTMKVGNLSFFQQVAQIRNAFFTSGAGDKVSLSPTFTVSEMDPSVVQLNTSIAGSAFHYVHGPVIPVPFSWPTGNSASTINMNAQPSVPGSTSNLSFNGPWALFRWIDSAARQSIQSDGSLLLMFNFNKRRVVFTLTGLTSDDRTLSSLLRNFRCPDAG